jgi:hypothetical protein
MVILPEPDSEGERLVVEWGNETWEFACNIETFIDRRRLLSQVTLT